MKKKFSLVFLILSFIGCSKTDGIMVTIYDESENSSAEYKMNIYEIDGQQISKMNPQTVDLNKFPFKIFVKASTATKFAIQVYSCTDNEINYLSERMFIHNGGYQEETFVLEQRCTTKDECILNGNDIPSPLCGSNPDNDAEIDATEDADSDADTDSDSDIDSDTDTDSDIVNDTSIDEINDISYDNLQDKANDIAEDNYVFDTSPDTNPCVDNDNDSYLAGVNCPEATDCDDSSDLCTTDCEDLDSDSVYDCKDPCFDEDKDGYGLDTGIGEGCLGYDCNDSNEYVNSGASKTCDNASLDYNCNGFIDNYEGCTSICSSSSSPIGMISRSSRISVSGVINKIFTAGSYSYLAMNGTTNSLTIANLSKKTATTVSLNNSANDLIAYNNYVYIVTNLISGNGLHVINAANPASPAITGSFPTNSNSYAIFYYSNNIFIGEAAGSKSVQVFSLANPGTPSIVSEGYTSSGNISDILVFERDFSEYIVASIGKTIVLLQRNGTSIDTLYTSSSLTTNNIISIYYSEQTQKLYLADGSTKYYRCDINTNPYGISCSTVSTTNGYIISDIAVRDGYVFLLTTGTFSTGYITITDLNNEKYLETNIDTNCKTLFVTDSNIFVGCTNNFYNYNFVCCLQTLDTCTQDSECCYNDCSESNECCIPNNYYCGSSEECCNKNCDSTRSICCLSDNMACSTGSECCTGYCNTSNVCSCKNLSDSCYYDEQCCSGFCSWDRDICCLDEGSDCTENSECCTNYCSGNICTCKAGGVACTEDEECCSELCISDECYDW